MLKVKTELRLITLFLLILGVTGCSNELPIGLAHDLERASDIKFGFVALIDSSTGQAKYLRNKNAGRNTEVGISRFSDLSQPASEITEVTTVSVLGVSGIPGYQSCNHITINSPRKGSAEAHLICRNNTESKKSELQDSDKALELPNLSRKLINRLADTGSIDNIGFLIFTDIVTGKTRLFKHEDYVDLALPSTDSPIPVTEVKNNNSWSIVTFRINPCHSYGVNSQGDRICTYLTYCPK